ncbi:MAG: hypothetical protein OXI24_06845 [Candidatus Poribacteria bacterium]|nr:hypothetical protein [Candidatus Poribacteria bacterium]
MNRFTSALYFVFIASLLAGGCTAPAFLMNPPESAPLPPDEKVQQTMETLMGSSISKAIQKWGAPHGISDDDAGSRIYMWQLSAQVFLAPQDNSTLSRRSPKVLNKATEPVLPTDDIYELTFYTDAKGVIYKTLTKRDQVSRFSSTDFNATK